MRFTGNVKNGNDRARLRQFLASLKNMDAAQLVLDHNLAPGAFEYTHETSGIPSRLVISADLAEQFADFAAKNNITPYQPEDN